MILVVFAHVETYMLSLDPGTTFISSLFLSFRMPLFFFISGYLVFKEDLSWTLDTWKRNVIKKIKVQLVPTFVFGLLYTYLFSIGNFYDFIGNAHKFGYWFTMALLGMLLIVYTINLFIGLCVKKSSQKWVTIMLLIIALMLFLFKFLYDKSPRVALVSDYFSFYQICVYFPFFVFGYIASQYKNKFAVFLNNDVIQAFILVLFCGLFYLKRTLSSTVYEFHELLLLYRCVQDTLLGLLGICIVYNFFRKNATVFSKEKVIGRQLQFIGSRTLEIYMLHYFFLAQVPKLGVYVESYPNIIVELVAVMVLTLIVVFLSLLVSKIVCTNRILAFNLFGKNNV